LLGQDGDKTDGEGRRGKKVKTLYDVIDVRPDATKQEIEAACLALGDRYHPERNAADPQALARFGEIEQAFAILTDDVARKGYDEELAIMRRLDDTFGGNGVT
jgi:DnaJ-class molecular chaperone